jgi:hypothetical protein
VFGDPREPVRIQHARLFHEVLNMKVIVNGREVNVPVDSDGTINSDVVREQGGLSSGRALIKHGRDGRNELVNPGQSTWCENMQHFSDAPITVRGVQR